MLEIRAYQQDDVQDMAGVWNEVVENGIAFPQEEALDAESAAAFFADQTHCGVAVEDERVVGLYILHPNNVGRCGHIANASYAVSSAARGKGERLRNYLTSGIIESCSILFFFSFLNMQ